MAIRVLLVDDHTLVRKGLSMLVRQQSNIEVIGDAGDGRTGVTMAAELSPDVVVMDVGMPDLNGIDATRQILERSSTTRVLALSAFSDRRHVLAVLQAGASGYVLKDVAVEELVEAIESVHAGKIYLSPHLTDTVIRECVVSTTTLHPSKLTTREREVLQLLVEGKAMKEVASILHISTKTVESHRRALMEKLQLFSMAELTKHALREGLTSLD